MVSNGLAHNSPDRHGLKLQIAKRSTGAAIIVPAVIHWKVAHFGAITAEDNGRYRIEDPTFDEAGSLWVSKKAVESQSDGYFLVPAGKLLPGWRSVSREEAEKVWGKGMATTRDPTMTSSCPQQTMSGGGGGSGSGGDGSGGAGGGGSGGGGPPPICPKRGMASASAFSMNASLGITDNPVGYTPPAGPDMQIEIKYNFNQGNQPGTFTFTNIGYDWNINWVSYLTVDGSSNVTVRVRGGGYEKYNFPYATTPNLTSQCLMANLGGGSYQRKWPDGTVENFTLSDGTNTYLTSVVDPQGNAATISYDANYRITGISDACGNAATTFAYVSNTPGNVGFYKVASITDGFSRSASFAYDSTTTKLISITDAAGNVSQFFYDTSSTFISMLTTPYGSTSFYKYTPTGGGGNPPVGLKVTYPDGSSAVIENWIGEQKATYFWDREATALYPTDPASHNYQHCKITRWLFASATNSEAPVGNWTRSPLESAVVTAYPGESVQNFVGTSNKPTQVARQFCGFRSTATITGTATPGNIVGIRVTDALIGPPETVQYTVQTGDTLSSIAAGLAAKINADVYISTFGISAAAASNVITLTSWSINSTAYASAPVGSPTATITIAAGPNPAETATLGGSVTAGNVLTITVIDSGLSGGQQSISYTVQTGDTLSTIAQELAMAINANTQLQGISVSAVWTGPNGVIGPIVSIKSDSPNTTTYTKSTSMGATTTITLSVTTNGIIQAWNYQRNTLGYMTQSIDPIGRQFNYTFAANNIDLLETRETKGTDNFLIGHWEYGNPSAAHRVTLYIDGSAQQTQYAYNTPFAELTTTTDANGNTTTRSYDSNGYLTQIDGPLSGSQDVTTFTFYGYGLVNTETDSEGYTRTYSYDDLNRRTSISYPDGTSEETIYERLDAVMSSDRLGRWTQRSFNSMDQLVCETDPLGRKTKYCWCSCGSLASLTDPKNQTTSWHHDIEGRVIEKVYADQTSINYAYEPYSPRLQSMTDALSQVTHFVYNIDDTLMQKSYTNAVNATSPVTIAYDPLFPRTKRTTNGWGQISNSYNPYATTLTNKAYIWIGGYPQTPSATDTISITFTNSALSGGQYTMPTYSVLSGDAGQPALVATHLATAITSNSTLSAAGISATANGTMITVSAGSTVSVNPTSTGSITATVGGGGRLAQVTNSVVSNSPISYSYDALGRTSKRMINGGNNSINWSFDAMSRITAEQDALGTFNYAYVDDTPGSSKGTLRLSSIGYPNSQTTNFSYYPNIADQRLQGISNLDPSSNTLSQFNYDYNPAGEITKWTQQQKSSHENLSIGYDLAGQLSSVQTGIGSSAPPFGDQVYYNYDSASNRTAVQQSQIQNARIGGTATATDVVTLTVKNSALSGGQRSVSYTVAALDSTSTIASQIAAAISADSQLQAIGVNATADSALVTLRSRSSNITTYSSSVAGIAPTETITIGTNKSIENVTIGGTPHTGDTLTLTIHDPALTGNPISKTYVVLLTDTLTSIATAMTTLINADATLSTAGITATSANQVIAVQSLSPNVTSYSTSVTGSGATTTITAGLSLNGTISSLVTGSTTTGDLVKVKVVDAGLSGGSETAIYTIASGDTLTAITAGIAGAINADTSLKAIGVTASSSGTHLNVTSVSTNTTSYRPYTSNSGGTAPGSAKIIASLPPNGTQTAAIGGSKTTGDVLTITVFDAGLSGGSEPVNYTVASGDNLATIASSIASAINGDSNLSGIGVTASATSTVVNITSTSTNATMYTQSVSSGATETITLGINAGVIQSAYNNVNELTAISPGGAVRFQGTTLNPVKSAVINVTQTATIAGSTITAQDVISLIVHNSSLSAEEVVNYVVQSGDTLSSIAASLTSAINADTNLQNIGVSATSSGSVLTISSASPNATTYNSAVSSGATETITLGNSQSRQAELPSSENFSGNPILAVGSNTTSITAISGGGTPATNTYPITVNSGSSTSLTHDANGNMTSDGTNSYSWDAENRLLQVTYPGSGNNSQFSYDGLGRCVKIVENIGGSTTSTKQFVWCGNERCEERDGSGGLTRQFFGWGEQISSTNYFYSKTTEGSTWELTNGSGTIVSQYGYSPYGEPTLLQGTNLADFQYAGYYLHQRSGLNLTLYRAYSSNLGRWISRDPIEEIAGINLYNYVSSDPINYADPFGLAPNVAQYPSQDAAARAGFNENRLPSRSAQTGKEFGFFIYQPPGSTAYGYTTPVQSTDPGGASVTSRDWQSTCPATGINSATAKAHSHVHKRPLGDTRQGYETFSQADMNSPMTQYLGNQYNQIRRVSPGATSDVIIQGPPMPPATTNLHQ
jgi:RHS repeat-associated protein